MLAELEGLLIGYNYVVSLHVYCIPYQPQAPIEWYVGEALGPATVIRESGTTTAREILADVEVGLRYVGDAKDGGGGPWPSVRYSPRFRELLAGVLAELTQAIASATLLGWFELADGLPGVGPVYWGFSYVIVRPDCAIVFIGAGSD